MTHNVLIDCNGLTLTPIEKEMIAHPAVAGIVLFARNYESPEQLRALTASIRAIKPQALITVDQEGGRIQRFKSGFTALPSMQHWGEQYNIMGAATFSALSESITVMVHELIDCGVSASLMPVLDCDHGRNSVISNRSFGADPEAVGVLGRVVIQALHEAGMRATAKHFPGHGCVSGDSHEVLPVDHRPFDVIKNSDLKPFVQLISLYDAVMPAHILYPAVDSRPVGFSPVWLKEILRGQLGFEGVIMSDDLTMAGAASMGGYLERAEAAVDAGCDLLLVCNDHAGAAVVLERMEKHSDSLAARRIARFSTTEMLSNLS